jgi:hypothetical protein
LQNDLGSEGMKLAYAYHDSTFNSNGFLGSMAVHIIVD